MSRVRESREPMVDRESAESSLLWQLKATGQAKGLSAKPRMRDEQDGYLTGLDGESRVVCWQVDIMSLRPPPCNFPLSLRLLRLSPLTVSPTRTQRDGSNRLSERPANPHVGSLAGGCCLASRRESGRIRECEACEKVGGAKASFGARNRQRLQLDSPTVTRGIRPQMPGLMRCRVRVGVGVGEGNRSQVGNGNPRGYKWPG